MEWRKSYLDVILIPLGILTCLSYHVWLWRRVLRQPSTTIIGINANGRRLWVAAIMKDNDKKNILAVQTLRNAIMGSTLMATTSILLCCGLAAVISSTYTIKMPINDSVFGGNSELMMALKYVFVLMIFLFSFTCHSMSIRFINQVSFLINCPLLQDQDNDYHGIMLINHHYVSGLLEKGFVLNIVGNRLFYVALPLLLWIIGPVLVFLCLVILVPVFYNLDIVFDEAKGESDHHHHHHHANGDSELGGV